MIHLEEPPQEMVPISVGGNVTKHSGEIPNVHTHVTKQRIVHSDGWSRSGTESKARAESVRVLDCSMDRTCQGCESLWDDEQ